MVDRIRKIQLLNDEVFSILNKYLNSGPGSGKQSYGVTIEHFDPPKYEC